MMSKSTTADLLKIGNKLEEFFSQQFKSSKKLFSSLEPGPWKTMTSKNKTSGPGVGQSSSSSSSSSSSPLAVSHHRHWQRALSKISGMKIYTLPFKLPDIGSVLGGNVSYELLTGG